MLKWIRLNREESIDEPITGEPGEAWRDGGCPKLRSISAVGEGKNWGEKSTKTQTRSEGEVLHPKTDVTITGLKKQNTPCVHVPKQGRCLTIVLFLILGFLSLLCCVSRCPAAAHYTLFASVPTSPELPEAKPPDSPPPLSIYTRADRTTVIHCYFGPRAPWSNSGKGDIGILCGSGGCFQSQITLPDR